MPYRASDHPSGPVSLVGFWVQILCTSCIMPIVKKGRYEFIFNQSIIKFSEKKTYANFTLNLTIGHAEACTDVLNCYDIC